MSRHITGWKLDAHDRAALLERFRPRYARTVADHVTLRFGTDNATSLPAERQGAIVGVSDDGLGVEAMVVSIGDTTDRGDGSHFHITWSLANGRAAKESNDVIKSLGWTAVGPIPVKLEPARWRA